MNSLRGRAAVQRRGKNRRRGFTAAVVVLVLALGVLSWFLIPGGKAPATADAVVVLAGASDGRHELGAELTEAGVAENFVVSNPLGLKDRTGSRFCRGNGRPEAARVWCMRPDPVNTAGEAMTVDELADAQGWESVVVVTNRPHTRRVRLMFEECTDLSASVVHINGVDWSRVPYQVTREVAGFIKHRITDPCTAEAVR